MGKEFGGKITVRTSSGEMFSLRGTMNFDTASQSNEAITNQDGSVDRVATPQARTAEFNFADRGINYDALMKAPRFNVTFDEEFTGATHLFTSAFIVGKPSINGVNGEVSGLSIAAESYTRIEA